MHTEKLLTTREAADQRRTIASWKRISYAVRAVPKLSRAVPIKRQWMSRRTFTAATRTGAGLAKQTPALPRESEPVHAINLEDPPASSRYRASDQNLAPTPSRCVEVVG